MKFTLVSDLHADFPHGGKYPYEDMEDVVIVAGDTTNGLEGLRFLNKMKNKGHRVYATLGNHEHYANISSGRDIYETAARFREEFPSYTEEEEFPIVLRTGWYTVTDELIWRNYMNDSKRMVVDADTMNKFAQQDALFIRRELEQWRDHQYKGIVVTHMAPCQETLDPKFEGQFSNEWYWNPLLSPLLNEFKDQILVWCHGHTHAFADREVGGVRVVCNPRGYPGENPRWKPYSIEI